MCGESGGCWLDSRRGGGRTGWGPFGLLQPIADLLKLITKEELMPTAADKIVFTLVPIVMLMSLLLSLAVIPFGRNTYLADLNVGILYFVAVGSISTIAIFMAGLVLREPVRDVWGDAGSGDADQL